jgi:hypothetical protein
MGASAAAPSGSDSPLGNVGPSRPFQFAEYEIATSNKVHGDYIFTPTVPDSLISIKNRTIYAFELAEGQKAILAAEYLADPKGALRYVPGFKRRSVEPKAAGKGTPVPAAALPLIRQVPGAKRAEPLRYLFVAIRGRLSKKTIWDIENDLAQPIFQHWDLADPSSFRQASGQSFVLVIDPITLAENLSKAYQGALIDAYNYIVPHENNPHREDVEIRNRKLQLARMIKESLLAPGGHTTDPLKIAGSLINNGSDLLQFVTDETTTLDEFDRKRKRASVDLVRFLKSRVWTDTHYWYMAIPQSDDDGIAHAFLDASFRCTDRLCETPEGREYERQLVEELESGTGILSYLFAPPKGAQEWNEAYWRVYPIIRKIATATVIGFVEMAPALTVWSKARAADKTIVATLTVWFESAQAAVVVRKPNGRVAAALRIRTHVPHVQIDYKKVKPDLTKWLEEGKPHWPAGGKAAEVAELMTKLFIGVETLNTFNKLSEMMHAFTSQSSEISKKITTTAEFVGAGLDLAVALEDPIRAWAEEQAAIREAGGHAPHVGAKAAEELEETKKEAEGLFGKLTKPAAFKVIGAVSAAIDVGVYAFEGIEALHKGDRGVAGGNFAIAGGSLLMLVGNLMNVASYIMTASSGATAGTLALTAAGATILVIGVVIVMIGFAVVEYFHRTAWQKFAEHCSFGKKHGFSGHEVWSAGDFSAWTTDGKGLDRQIEVLTAMLCAFRAEGDTGDNHSILFTFGVVPPKSRLMLDLSITYENNQTNKLEYEIDLDNPYSALNHSDSAHEGDHHAVPADIGLKVQDGRLVSMVVRAERLVSGPVKTATCEAAIRFAPGSSGKVPVEGEFKYTFVENGHIHSTEMDSLDVGAE